MGIALPALMDGCGYEPEEKDLLHYFLKATYFQCEQDKRGIYRNVPHLFRKNAEDDPHFMDYCGRVGKDPNEVRNLFVDWVIRKAAEYGVYVEPNQ
jgi:hypothetical protein